jgi:hypothetical protein
MAKMELVVIPQENIDKDKDIDKKMKVLEKEK